jgi:hypothetical protein
MAECPLLALSGMPATLRMSAFRGKADIGPTERQTGRDSEPTRRQYYRQLGRRACSKAAAAGARAGPHGERDWAPPQSEKSECNARESQAAATSTPADREQRAQIIGLWLQSEARFVA